MGLRDSKLTEKAEKEAERQSLTAEYRVIMVEGFGNRMHLATNRNGAVNIHAFRHAPRSERCFMRADALAQKVQQSLTL